MKLESKAHGFFNEALKKNDAFIRGMKQVRRDLVDAAFYFLQARQCFEHGEWGTFCAMYKDRISDRTIRSYCQMAEAAIEWVREAQPALKSVIEIQAAAREIMLQSPKQLVGICREVGFMRKFGEYDAVKYQQKRIGNGNQIEFNFEQVVSSLDVLTHFGDSNYSFVYPDGKDEVEFMGEVEAKLEAALRRVREIKKHGRVIEA